MRSATAWSSPVWLFPEKSRLLRLGPCDDEGVGIVDFIEHAPGDRELSLSKQARARVRAGPAAV